MLSDKIGWIFLIVGVIIGLVFGIFLGLAGSQLNDAELDERLRSSVGIEQVITNHQVEGSSPSGVSTIKPAVEIINVKPHMF